MENNVKKRKIPKRTLVSIFIILLLIPATIWVFQKGGNKNWYLASMLIVVYTMLPFFMIFESRKPQARELVVIAVMCAIAVASRAAFIMLPNFKPLVAVVMITGIAFGPEAGFLTGAVSAFASNFIFGQGPWTPWQMFAYGIAGFLMGLLNMKGLVNRKPVLLASLGAVITFAIVGPLLDTCALFTMSNMIDTTVISAVYISGIPVNLVHASCSFLTLLLFSKSMLEKLDRIKIKYGMLEDEI